jgi:hypothetical protein
VELSVRASSEVACRPRDSTSVSAQVRERAYYTHRYLQSRGMVAHVAFVANEGYAKGLAVTVKSLLDSLRSVSPVETTAESTTCLRSVGLCGSVVPTEPVNTVHVWLVDTRLHDESWAKLDGMVHDHNKGASGEQCIGPA